MVHLRKVTEARGHAISDDTQRLVAYREPAATRLVRLPEEHTVVAYDEPWNSEHLVGWAMCLFWNGIVALFLATNPRNPLILFCHLPLGLWMTYGMLRWGRSKLRLAVGPSHLVCATWPFANLWTWRVKREDIQDVLVTQRLFRNDGDWAEWIVSVRLVSQETRTLSRRGSNPDAPLPTGMDRLVTQLAYELLRPVTREVRDERKR